MNVQSMTFCDYADVKDKLRNRSASAVNDVIFNDINFEENSSNVVSIIKLGFNFTSQKMFLISNKSYSMFSFGESYEANIKLKDCEDLQFSILWMEGKWFIRDAEHRDDRKRTWFDIRTETEKDYQITQNTKILVGKSILEVSFPNL